MRLAIPHSPVGRRLARSGLLAAMLALAGHAASSASQMGAPLVSARVVLVGTTVDGEPADASAGGRGLRIGESQTVGLFTGTDGDPADLCDAHGAGDARGMNPRHVWTVTVKPVAVNGERITLDVDWKRLDGGGQQQRAGDQRTITLPHGGQHVLDFVSASPKTSRCVGVEVRIEASLVDEPGLARTTLGYDLWLVDDNGAGRQASRRIQIAASQREAINFRFLPIGWQSDGAPTPDDRRPDVSVEIGVRLKGRLQPDGSVQVGVTPNRIVRIDGRSASSGYREETLTAKPGETIRMDIPPSGPDPVRSHRTSLSLTVHAR